MNILTDLPPTTVQVGGQEWSIHYDFRVGARFETMILNPEISDEEKVEQALNLYYPIIPSDAPGALDALLWFYRCGKDPGEEKSTGGRQKPRRAYCFEEDADLIFAAFLEAYGIDLSASDMHWWTFRALLLGLPRGCELVKVMGYRTADLKGMDKAQRRFYEQMRKKYALKEPGAARRAMSLEERDRRMKEHIAKRFEEAGETGER